MMTPRPCGSRKLDAIWDWLLLEDRLINVGRNGSRAATMRVTVTNVLEFKMATHNFFKSQNDRKNLNRVLKILYFVVEIEIHNEWKEGYSVLHV